MRTTTMASGCLLATLLATSAAKAQATGFSLNNYDPSERGSDWFASESLDLRGNLRPVLGVTGDYAYRPLGLFGSGVNYQHSVVDDQLTLHAGGSLVLFDRLRLGFNVPVVLQQIGQGSAVLDTVTYTTPTASSSVGDVRLGADARLFGEYGEPVTVAVGAHAYVPSGSRNDFTGDHAFRLEPRIMAAGDIGVFTYAARVGVMVREFDSANGSPLGTQLTFGVAAGVRLADKKLTVGPEVWGGAQVAQNDNVYPGTTNPVEGILGAHYLIADQVKVGAGAGTALTRGFGTPAFRGLLSVEWAPGPEKKVSDRDRDGIPDDEDACPDVAGVRTDDARTNGCPPPPPPEPPPPPPPPPAAPPPPPPPPPPADRDHDGILDADDACPDEPGVPNADPKKNGCPAAVVRNNQIVIMEQVKFATGSADILPASDGLLEAVAKVLRDHAEIKHVSVEGHTDNVGVPARNKQLSARRAASVVAWLVKHGVDKARLTSIGFGSERAIDTNDTDAGRQNNRRVEFHIQH